MVKRAAHPMEAWEIVDRVDAETRAGETLEA